MSVSFWISFLVAWICCGVVVACLVAKAHARAIEKDARFWAELHGPPSHVTKRPR